MCDNNYDDGCKILYTNRKQLLEGSYNVHVYRGR